MTPRHFLYPLNPKSKQQYWFEDPRGNRHPTSVEGFFDCYSDGQPAEWGLSQMGKELKRGDYIWVHFALPVSAVMAVGRVRQTPHFREDWGVYAVRIDWDWALTDRLQRDPIRYSSHKQRAQKSVTEANSTTLRVIQRWMQRTNAPPAPLKVTPVKFKQVEIEQRQGQPAFRQALMVAYNHKCAVTGCDTRDTLQAAHITPVARGGHHGIHNGILLRADIHNLFDRGLLTITDSYKVHLHPSIRDSVIYGHLHGQKLKSMPSRTGEKPSIQALRQHRKTHLSS